MSLRKQKGLSILEILIGIFISFIIIVAIIGLFSNTITGSQRVLDRGKLDRDLFAAMDVIAYDIQRAGMWINATNSNSTNPFMSGTNLITTNASANCITFAYDKSTDGTNSTTDQFGYGMSPTGNAIQFRQGGTTCTPTAAGSGWENLTDPNVITISNFQITATNVGVNVSGIGTNTTRYRTVTVTITGNLKNDASNTRTITRTIKVYNNQYST